MLPGQVGRTQAKRREEGVPCTCGVQGLHLGRRRFGVPIVEQRAASLGPSLEHDGLCMQHFLKTGERVRKMGGVILRIDT